MPTEFARFIRMLRERVKGVENVVFLRTATNDLGLA